MKNTFIYTIIFTFILCFLFVAILSFTNIFTKDKIEENELNAQNRAILYALGIKAESDKEIVQEFKKVKNKNINGKTYYMLDDPQQGTLYATYYEGAGLWGSISGYIATNESVSQIVGFSITSQSETPGLGARISEDWFLEQLRGEAIVGDGIKVRSGGTGDEDKNNGSIDGVTGATRTSEAIQQIIFKAVAQLQSDLR